MSSDESPHGLKAPKPPAALNRKWLWSCGFLLPLLPLIVGLVCREHGSVLMRWETVTGGILLLVASVSAITDLRWQKIYNAFVFPALLWLIALNIIDTLGMSEWRQRLGTVGLSWALAGGGLCFLATLLPYLLAQGGAGDVKLATVFGVGLGVHDGLITICFALVIAAIFGIIRAMIVYGPVFVRYVLVRWIKSFFFRTHDSRSPAETRVLREPVPLAPAFWIALLGTLTGFWEKLPEIMSNGFS